MILKSEAPTLYILKSSFNKMQFENYNNFYIEWFCKVGIAIPNPYQILYTSKSLQSMAKPLFYNNKMHICNLQIDFCIFNIILVMSTDVEQLKCLHCVCG